MDEHKIVSVDVEGSSDIHQYDRGYNVAKNRNKMAFNVGGLKNRHLVMISFGGGVGASIWYGVCSAVADCGPLGALICFLFIGLDVFSVMQALGRCPPSNPFKAPSSSSQAASSTNF
ncbi:hypothetical protein EJ03DRAFT_348991 [Teratosphaeria nubilosa]|uniref:Amino acid permease/ SLC12A domain-containing protein n=1 Tax=Teratosphaeria nubilosa TaxID=161662 RepID=A0A6G1LHU5_9PEZI|nr:hypothetical protein EJ03DRAFT_348991 [Teratosphaeria nubilosa]